MSCASRKRCSKRAAAASPSSAWRAAVVREHDELGLTFPILLGTGLKLTYAVEATPKLVVLDAAGVVRDSHIGWGLETPAAIRAELRRWVADGSK
jgi:hypothetical protein